MADLFYNIPLCKGEHSHVLNPSSIAFQHLPSRGTKLFEGRRDAAGDCAAHLIGVCPYPVGG